MAKLTDPEVQDLLTKPNFAVVSTHNEDGTIHSAVIWVNADDDGVLINSAKGRKWPTNVDRDPHVTVTVFDHENPYKYVAVTGSATGTTDGADEHIDALAKKYLDKDTYPFRQDGEVRVKYVIKPEKVRYQAQ